MVTNFVVVGVDSPTLNYFAQSKRYHAGNFPFPRRYDAQVVNNLVKAGASTSRSTSSSPSRPTIATTRRSRCRSARPAT